MPQVFVSLGSNIDREKNIVAALAELKSLFGPLTVSSVYESQAVGFAGDDFYNLVVRFDSALPVGEVARALRTIEIAHGRTNASRKFESRTLDIDLLMYGKEIVEEGRLRLPREDICKHAFVLEPLSEIAPDFRHPALGLTFSQLWQSFDKRKTRQKRLSVSLVRDDVGDLTREADQTNGNRIVEGCGVGRGKYGKP